MQKEIELWRQNEESLEISQVVIEDARGMIPWN